MSSDCYPTQRQKGWPAGSRKTRRCLRLVRMLNTSEFDDSSLGDIKIFDGHVQVHLLRCGRTRPLWRGETINFLEPDRIAVGGSDVTGQSSSVL